MNLKIHILIYLFLASSQAFSAQSCQSLASSFIKQDRYERVLKMQSRYRGEESLSSSYRPVTYLSQSEREEKILSLKNANIKIGNQDFSCSSHGCDKIFVMSPTGKIYIGDSRLHNFHHSSFLAGKPVSGAGNFKIKNNQIIYLDNLSGHYKPEIDHTFQVVEELLKRGFEFPQKIRITLGTNHEIVDLNFKEVIEAYNHKKMEDLIFDETDYLHSLPLKERGKSIILTYVDFLKKHEYL